LEFSIDISDSSDYLKNVVVNLDWGKFRELRMARQLDGMEEHPLLQDDNQPDVSNVRSSIDIEVMWNLNESVIFQIAGQNPGNQRVELASEWMDSINRHINEMLAGEDLMSRWHVELEGDNMGRYVSVMSFISYFQHNFESTENLNDLHKQLKGRIRKIIHLSSRLVFYTKATVPKSA
jgi:non-ribosomal peptide synthetase component F